MFWVRPSYLVKMPVRTPTSGLPVIQTRSVRPAWSLPRLCGFITPDTAGRLLLLLVEHLLYVESDVSVATNIVVTHLRMSIGIRNATWDKRNEGDQPCHTAYRPC